MTGAGKTSRGLPGDSSPGALLICSLITVVMMHSYIFPLGAVLYANGIKGQDCYQMIWNLWFVNEAITSGHSPFSSSLIFYPEGANLSHHTLAAGFFPVTFLVKGLSGNDPLYAFYAFKIILLLSFTLILWLSYLTLREIGLTRWAALIPAVGYAFSDFYMAHVIHLNHPAGFFIPLTALFVIRAYKNPASGNLGFAALAAGGSVYFTEFSVYIYMGACFFLLTASLIRSWRRDFVAKIKEAGFRRAIVSVLIFVMLVTPFAVNLFKDRIVNPSFRESSHYSANLAGFFIPGQERNEAELCDAPTMTTPLYGQIFAAIDSRITAGVGGSETFVGFPLLLFGIVGLARSRQGLAWLCVFAGLLFFVLSLGPTLKIFGTETGFPMPYAILAKVPPFDSGRTPVRFIVIGLFFLMIVAGFGLSWTEKLVTDLWGPRWAGLAMLFLLTWATAEVYSPIQRRQPFVPPPGLGKVVPGAVLNLPPVQWDGYAAMLQTFHHQPIATGYLARNNAAQWAQFAVLKTAFDKGGATFCEYVRSKGFRNIIIAPDSVTLPYRFSMTPLELSQCSVNIVDLRDRGPHNLVQPDGSERPVEYPIYTSGTRLHFGTAEVDKYLWYGWSGREIVSHWTDRGKAALIFFMNSGERQNITLRIFGGPFLSPGKLDAQRVILNWNDQQIANWTLTRAEPQEQSIVVPANALREQNILTFILPDAASPSSLGISEDGRLLGFNVQWIEID